MAKLFEIMSYFHLMVGILLLILGLVDFLMGMTADNPVSHIAAPVWTGVLVIAVSTIGIVIGSMRTLQNRTGMVHIFKALCMVLAVLSFLILILYGVLLAASYGEGTSHRGVNAAIFVLSIAELFLSFFSVFSSSGDPAAGDFTYQTVPMAGFVGGFQVRHA